ncbi:MAG: catalase [Cyanobacteria bacterium P01_D01_bin.44]
MKLFTEYPEKAEEKYSALVAQAAKANIENLYKEADRALRDTHAKTHACVKGTLEIFDFDEAAIQETLKQRTALTDTQIERMALKQGLLAAPKQYPVWLRFANGRSKVMNDYESDTRSMSVKIIGVEGERLPQSHETQTQDIITQNAEIFFIKTIKNYYGFFTSVMKGGIFPLVWLLLHPKQFSALKSITSRYPKSLLTERYWSGSASTLGLPSNFDPSQSGQVPVTYPAVVKYAFTPVASQSPYRQLPYESRPEADRDRAKAESKQGTQDNYYRDELIQNLASPEAKHCWAFEIQVQTRPDMPIDDVAVVWPEADAPFFKVGRLTVAHQLVDFDQQCDFCENLRFSPWNGLAVHRPVGALNRLRSRIYTLIGEYRHQKRGTEYREPNGQESFE